MASLQKKCGFTFIGVLLLLQTVSAQENTTNREAFRLKMEETSDAIIIDGVIEEKVWMEAEVASNFHKVTPVDEGFPKSESEVRMLHDDRNIYIAITCWDSIPGRRPVESLRRDFSFGANDNFIVFIDTYNDQTNGFAFGISAVGAQWEGIQADGGFVSLNWDTKWRSGVKNYDDRWTAEFAIPYRSIRYKDGATEWGINFSRLDLKSGEKSAWAPVPRQFQTANLAFTGTLHWDKPLDKKGIRYAAIPYIFGQTVKSSPDAEAEFTSKIGMDAKITVSTSLNLDLSLNPDFSQVEVDQQQINLDRFELFFPERRQFFLENSDLFASLGSRSNRPFFSRRIGLNNPVLGGARLSGKIGDNSRIGLMNMQTQTSGDIAANNFTVAVFQQGILKRSNISAFFINRQLTDNSFSDRQDASNSVLGFDFNLFSEDNKWTGKLFYHQSLYENAGSDALTLSGNLVYDTPVFTMGVTQSYTGDNYKADVGFVRRTGIMNTNIESQYRFFPSSSKMASHGPGVELDFFRGEDFELRDRQLQLNYSFTWLDRSNLEISLEENFIRLIDDFDPTNTGGEKLIANNSYSWFLSQARFVSNPVDLVNYELGLGYGGYFNGSRLAVETTLSYRFQPFAKISALVSYNDIRLPDPYSSARLLLLGPKFDFTFTDKIFLTAYTQYNSQIDNLNLNIRFQWRFAPVSDFFIVYTQNTFTENFLLKDRGLAVKVSYWLN